MQIALRLSPDTDKLSHKAASWAIAVRLVTKFPHAGLLVGDTLMHATSAHGVTAEPFGQRDNWITVDVPGLDDAPALQRFEQVKGRPYDWFSLLAFAGLPARDSQRWYCYELVHYLMTGQKPTGRVTPEDLLMLVAKG